MEACGFRDAFSKIQQAGATVYGVSADSVSAQKKFKDKNNLPYHLLADMEKKMCADYGVLKEKNMYGRKSIGIARTTFLLTPDGKVAKVFENVKPDGHVEEVLAAIKTM